MVLTKTDLQGCEHCGNEFPIEDCHMMVDTWICDRCYREWKAEFDTCDHEWEPETDQYGDPGRFCRKCHGFVIDD